MVRTRARYEVLCCDCFLIVCQFGNDAANLRRPFAVTETKSKQLVVLDDDEVKVHSFPKIHPSHSRIKQIFDAEGRLFRKFNALRSQTEDKKSDDDKDSKDDEWRLGPNGIVVDCFGDILVTVGGRVAAYSSEGTFLYEFGVGVLKDPSAMCVDRQGRVYVCDNVLRKVFVFAV